MFTAGDYLIVPPDGPKKGVHQDRIFALGKSLIKAAASTPAGGVVSEDVSEKALKDLNELLTLISGVLLEYNDKVKAAAPRKPADPSDISDEIQAYQKLLHKLLKPLEKLGIDKKEEVVKLESLCKAFAPSAWFTILLNQLKSEQIDELNVIKAASLASTSEGGGSEAAAAAPRAPVDLAAARVTRLADIDALFTKIKDFSPKLAAPSAGVSPVVGAAATPAALSASELADVKRYMGLVADELISCSEIATKEPAADHSSYITTIGNYRDKLLGMESKLEAHMPEAEALGKLKAACEAIVPPAGATSGKLIPLPSTVAASLTAIRAAAPIATAPTGATVTTGPALVPGPTPPPVTPPVTPAASTGATGVTKKTEDELKPPESKQVNIFTDANGNPIQTIGQALKGFFSLPFWGVIDHAFLRVGAVASSFVKGTVATIAGSMAWPLGKALTFISGGRAPWLENMANQALKYGKEKDGLLPGIYHGVMSVVSGALAAGAYGINSGKLAAMQENLRKTITKEIEDRINNDPANSSKSKAEKDALIATALKTELPAELTKRYIDERKKQFPNTAALMDWFGHNTTEFKNGSTNNVLLNIPALVTPTIVRDVVFAAGNIGMGTAALGLGMLLSPLIMVRGLFKEELKDSAFSRFIDNSIQPIFGFAGDRFLTAGKNVWHSVSMGLFSLLPCSLCKGADGELDGLHKSLDNTKSFGYHFYRRLRAESSRRSGVGNNFTGKDSVQFLEKVPMRMAALGYLATGVGPVFSVLGGLARVLALPFQLPKLLGVKTPRIDAFVKNAGNMFLIAPAAVYSFVTGKDTFVDVAARLNPLFERSAILPTVAVPVAPPSLVGTVRIGTAPPASPRTTPGPAASPTETALSMTLTPVTSPAVELTLRTSPATAPKPPAAVAAAVVAQPSAVSAALVASPAPAPAPKPAQVAPASPAVQMSLTKGPLLQPVAEVSPGEKIGNPLNKSGGNRALLAKSAAPSSIPGEGNPVFASLMQNPLSSATIAAATKTAFNMNQSSRSGGAIPQRSFIGAMAHRARTSKRVAASAFAAARSVMPSLSLMTKAPTVAPESGAGGGGPNPDKPELPSQDSTLTA